MVLSQGALRQIIEAQPKVAMSAIQFLCSRLRETDERFEAIALHRVEVRLCRLLLSTPEVNCARHESETVKLNLGMSQTELALLAGASRSKVNRALMALEDMGAITRTGSTIVCDIQALEDIAERDVAADHM